MANKRKSALVKAQEVLYSLAGGSLQSGDVTAAKITAAQRLVFFRSAEFRNWVRSEKRAGREVFWLKDVDMTQAAGDIFTFFFQWRADNNKFSAEQLEIVHNFMVNHKSTADRHRAWTHGAFKPHDVLQSWRNKEGGGEGISPVDFWLGVYWPSQMGMTRAEKQQQVADFAPHYIDRIYPDTPADNRALEDAGVHVVIVSNGDQELALGVAPLLGIKTENAVGSNLLYGEDGRAKGVNHSYEVFDHDSVNKPQAGKAFSFHYWLHMNRQRWGWNHIDDDRFIIAGRDGDSASSDGGMMMLLKPPAIGNFMVDTPDKPDRIQKFYAMAAKYGWTAGQFITLQQKPSFAGNMP